MNALLDKALAELAQLPDGEQEAVVALILAEIGAERGWEERFADTQDQLGAPVRSARAEAARGDVLSDVPSDRSTKVSCMGRQQFIHIPLTMEVSGRTTKTIFAIMS